MERFTIFHLYLIFFLLGLGYSVLAAGLGKLMGGGEDGDGADGDHDDLLSGKSLPESDADQASHDHGGTDMEAGGESMPNISPLSPVTIATFVTSFGGVGLILDKAGLPTLLSFPAAGGSGFAIAAVVFYVFHRVFTITQSTSGVSVRHAVGREAQVITPIPEKGVGEIAYVLGGRRFNAPARTEDGHPIPARTAVVIERRVGGMFQVREAAMQRGETR